MNLYTEEELTQLSLTELVALVLKLQDKVSLLRTSSALLHDVIDNKFRG